ncbi:MAG: glycosyltransferase family 39 protein [Anaerolineae bacterium]|nr:glycosyltransferase family 39 protein [Anaerolineae bacterium]
MRKKAGILVVLLLAARLRVAALGGEALWIDETFSLWAAGEPLVAGPAAVAANDVHPPLYFILLGFWTRLAGDSELAGRYFSALAGVLSAALVYALGRRLSGARAGLCAALVFAVMGMPVRYARELRMYALLCLLSIAATYAYVRWLERPTRRRAALYAAPAAMLPFTHYYGAFILLFHNIHFALRCLSPRSTRSTRRLLRSVSLRDLRALRGDYWLLIQAGVWGAFVLLWLPALRWQMQLRPAGIHHAAPTDWTTVQYCLEYLLDNSVWVAALAALGVAAACRGSGRVSPLSPALSPTRGERELEARAAAHSPLAPCGRGGQGVRGNIPSFLLLLLWFGAPFIGGLLLNLLSPSLTLRNLIGITPAVALLAGLGMSRLPRAGRWGAAALVLYTALATYPAYYPANPPWREFVREAARQTRPGDVLLYHLGPAPISHPFEYYRRREPAFAVEPISLFDLPGPPSAPGFTEGVRTLAAGAPRVWVVTSYETPLSWYAFTALRRTHHLSHQAHFSNVSVYLFEPPAQPVVAYRLGDCFRLTPVVRSRPPYHPGDAFEAALAWEVLAAPAVDYSVGLHLVNTAFRPGAQADGYPEPHTSTWEAGDAYTTVHQLRLPDDLPPGRYDMHLVVYTWWDNRRLWVWDAGSDMLFGDYILLDTLTVEAR